MHRYDLDVLVATSPVNITYFSDYYWWIDSLFKQYMMMPGASTNLFQSYAMFPLEDEPALILGPISAANATDSWVKDIYLFGGKEVDTTLEGMGHQNTNRLIYDLVTSADRSATPTDALVAALNDRNLTEAKIGVEFDRLPSDTAATLRQTLPHADLKDCSNLLRLIRMVKSEEELLRLTRAADIAEHAGLEILDTARPGDRIGDLVHNYKVRIAEMGADFDHFIYSMRGTGIASEAEYTISDDEVMYIDWGVLYRHYFSDTGTTLAMSEPTGAIRDRYNAVVDCMEAGIATLKPDGRSSEAYEAMWQVLSDHGVKTAFPHGHGLGVEIRDFPIFVANNGLRIQDDCVNEPSDIRLEEGMVVNLEAPIFMPDVGSLHNEQTFVITANGCRQLVPQRRSHPLIPTNR